LSAQTNGLDGPPPRFNKDFVPEAPEYKGAGYRPGPPYGVSAAQSR
jgi:hypothetical protein